MIPSEFILIRDPDHDLAEHHRELLANGLAQTAALLEGQDEAKIDNIHAQDDLTELALEEETKALNGQSHNIPTAKLNEAWPGGRCTCTSAKQS